MSRLRLSTQIAKMTGCLEVRFRLGAGLLVSRSALVWAVRGWPLVTAVFRSFWHACGTRQRGLGFVSLCLQNPLKVSRTVHGLA